MGGAASNIRAPDHPSTFTKDVGHAMHASEQTDGGGG